MNARKEFLGILFDVLDRKAVQYCVLRNYKNIYADLSSDIDLIVEPEHLSRLKECLAEAASRSGHFLVHRARYVNFSFVYGHENGRLVRIDVETEVRWRFFPVLSAKAVLGLRRQHEGFYIPHPRHEIIILIVAAIWRGILPDRYRTRLAELYQALTRAELQALRRTLAAIFGGSAGALASMLAQINQGRPAATAFKGARLSLILISVRSAPNFNQFIHFLFSDLKRFAGRLVSPPGISLLFVSSASPAEDPDKLFEKIEFLYPIQKSVRSLCTIPAGKARRAGLSLRMRIKRWHTLFKGGLFLRAYQLARDEDIPEVVQAHSHYVYPGRVLICAQNAAGQMWIRQGDTGLITRSKSDDGSLSSHDHLIRFILQKIEALPDRFGHTGQSGFEPAFTSGESSGLRSRLAKALPLRRLAYSAAWLSVIGTLSFLSLGFLKNRARSIAEDTLPGLTYAGAANANLAQAFNRTLILLMTDDSQEKAKLAAEIDRFSNRTTALLVAYKNAIYANEDADLFGELLR